MNTSTSDSRIFQNISSYLKIFHCTLGYFDVLLDTSRYFRYGPTLAQHRQKIAEDRLPISCHCWNDNSGMHLVANSGPNSARQHFFRNSNEPMLFQSLVFLLLECFTVVKVTHPNRKFRTYARIYNGRSAAPVMASQCWLTSAGIALRQCRKTSSGMAALA